MFHLFKTLFAVSFVFFGTFQVAQAAEDKRWLEDLRYHSRSNSCPPIKEWTNKWSCDDEPLCDQIESCEEAFYRLIICRQQERDGGYKEEATEPDGVPCENKCFRVDDDEPDLKTYFTEKCPAPLLDQIKGQGPA